MILLNFYVGNARWILIKIGQIWEFVYTSRTENIDWSTLFKINSINKTDDTNTAIVISSNEKYYKNNIGIQVNCKTIDKRANWRLVQDVFGKECCVCNKFYNICNIIYNEIENNVYKYSDNEFIKPSKYYFLCFECEIKHINGIKKNG